MENKENSYAKWLSGEITDAELQSLEGENTVQELRRIVKTVDQWSMPAYNTSAGYDKFKNRQTEDKVEIKKGNGWKWIGLVIIFLALLIIGWLSFFQNNQEVHTAKNGVIEKIDLMDGTIIMANDGSQIRYDIKKWEEVRNVDLKGESYFEVSKGSPFTVNTENGSITVLGTQFNVRAWGDNLYVECYEGSVQVSADNQTVVLKESESVNVVLGSMKVKQAINHEQPLWTKGTSRFYDEKIVDVFAEIERQYDYEIQAPDIDNSFSGNFAHDSLSNALRKVCLPLGLNFQIIEDQKLVLIE